MCGRRNWTFPTQKFLRRCDGRVTRKAVEPGDYVQVGQTLMSLVPTDVCVVANFKESQLKKMKPGQPALVEIDALGGRTFRAHVDSIQAGSGAAFSLLPPENATGNYVKVVQRVPVKILFDEAIARRSHFWPRFVCGAERARQSIQFAGLGHRSAGVDFDRHSGGSVPVRDSAKIKSDRGPMKKPREKVQTQPRDG